MTSSDGGRRRVAALAAAGTALSLGVVAARVAVDSRAALRAGLAAEGQGQQAEAIHHYLDAARLYLPGSPWVRQALDRLDALAASGDAPTARRALEAMRAAILGARSFYTPGGARLTAIDARLAQLYAGAEDAAVDPGATRTARVAWHAARLARRPGPALPFALLALAGLALWVGAAVGFLRRGLDVGLRLRRVPAITMGVLLAVGVALFVAGLRGA